MLERALNAPPRFSRRRFLATSTTTSLAFALASQPGRLSADGTATESSGSNGDNPSNTGQPWTIELNVLSKGDGTNDGPDQLAFNWRVVEGTTKGGTAYLLAVRWRLEPECFVGGVGKKQDEWTYKLNALAQVRVDPIAAPVPLPPGAEKYMVANGKYYSALLLDAQGDMYFKIIKSPSGMKCVLASANTVSDREEKIVNGKKFLLILEATHLPTLHSSAASNEVLPVLAHIGASVIETKVNSDSIKFKLTLKPSLVDLLPAEVSFENQPPPSSDYSNKVETKSIATFVAKLGSPDCNCALPPL
jgi:hypothetical protein